MSFKVVTNQLPDNVTLLIDKFSFLGNSNNKEEYVINKELIKLVDRNLINFKALPIRIINSYYQP